jgi:DNA-binding CsgD family transcriptional regulator
LEAAGNVTGVLILTTFERDDYVFNALRLGASGFLLKTAPPEDLISAVNVVAAGDALLSPSVTRRVISRFARHQAPLQPPDALQRLTERETEVLRLLAEGMSHAEIGGEVFVGEATVKTHMSNILSKLGLRDRVQAVIFAYEHGITGSLTPTRWFRPSIESTTRPAPALLVQALATGQWAAGGCLARLSRAPSPPHGRHASRGAMSWPRGRAGCS